MPISTQDIVTRCQAELQAENSEYWLFDQDYKPAINSAQDFIIGLVNPLLGTKKFSEEIFADVTYARVFQASTFSRIRIVPADLGHDVWTILSVEPLPDTNIPYSPLPLNPNESKYRDDLTPLTITNYAQRLTSEEWAKNARNPFADGHLLEAGEVARSYSYLNYTNYSSSSYTFSSVPQEIEVRPSVGEKPVTVRYAKVPKKVNLITDNVEFPAFCMNTIVQATQVFLGIKIGDKTTLESISSQFLQMMLGGST